MFRGAQCVKVNPDSPQKQVRFFTLTGELFYSAVGRERNYFSVYKFIYWPSLI